MVAGPAAAPAHPPPASHRSYALGHPHHTPTHAGCGKTTLLGSIAGSAMDLSSSAAVTGVVQVDGHRRRKSHVAYVPQSDVLIPSLTVQECLRYSALLRLPPNTPPLDLQVGGGQERQAGLPAGCGRAVLGLGWEEGCAGQTTWCCEALQTHKLRACLTACLRLTPTPTHQVAIERALDDLGLRHICLPDCLPG